MKNFLRAIALVCVGLISQSCETKVDLLAPYKSAPVVYAIINPSDSVHYVKITKTFLGEGNALDFAQVADSSLIPDLKPEIDEFVNGVLKRTFVLGDTIIEGKSEGIFYQEKNQVYYFVATDLTPSSVLKLRFDFNDKKVTAETPVLALASLNSPLSGIQEFRFVTGNIYNSFNYAKLPVVFNSVAHAREFQITGQFSYLEVYKDGSSQEKIVILPISNGLLTRSANDVTSKTANYEGESFFATIKTRVDVDDNVLRREIGRFEVLITGVETELSTYLLVNTPSSGISQSKPEYTNVKMEDGTAFGVFSCKSVRSKKLPFSTDTQRAIAGFEDMRPYKFCSPDPALASEATVYCQ